MKITDTKWYIISHIINGFFTFIWGEEMARARIIQRLNQFEGISYDIGVELWRVKPPKEKSDFFSNYQNPYLGVFRSLKNQQNWEIKLEQYNAFLAEYKEVKSELDTVVRTIKQTVNKQTIQEFARLTLKFYTALNVVNQCQGHLAHSFKSDDNLLVDRNDSLSIDLVMQQAELNRHIKEYKDVMTNVSVIIADHQLSNVNVPEIVILKEIIPQIQKVYDDAYKKEYPWMGWFKKLFKKSDRAKEIDFLNTLSQDWACDENIRAQAVSLVHNKILKTETFGGNSRLATLLDTLLFNYRQSPLSAQKEEKEEYNKLVAFLGQYPSIESTMPTSLQKYLGDHSEYEFKPKTSWFS